MTSFKQLRDETTNVLNDILYPVLTKIVGEYYLETIALIFKEELSNREYVAETICYKAMDVVEWWACVDSYEKNKKKFNSLPVFFKCNRGKYVTNVELMMDSRCIHSVRNKKLKDALEIIYPQYIGNDIDVFETLKDVLLHGKSRTKKEMLHEMNEVDDDGSEQWLAPEYTSVDDAFSYKGADHEHPTDID